MLSFPNNVRFRFSDIDRNAQIIIGKKDYEKMVKKLSKMANINKSQAVTYLNIVFYDEIKRVYGEPSNLTLVLDDRTHTIN